jgi:hypothetical protein
MSNGHPTRPFCHSSTLEGYICYILRAIFSYEGRGYPRLSWGFIGASSPRATVEGARRPLQIAWTTTAYGRRVLSGPLKRPQAR